MSVHPAIEKVRELLNDDNIEFNSEKELSHLLMNRGFGIMEDIGTEQYGEKITYCKIIRDEKNELKNKLMQFEFNTCIFDKVTGKLIDTIDDSIYELISLKVITRQGGPI